MAPNAFSKGNNSDSVVSPSFESTMTSPSSDLRLTEDSVTLVRSALQ
jgi:hypothetical protein